MALRILLASLGLAAITQAALSDTCIFEGGLTGAGSDGKEHSDILTCPSQPGAVDILCPATLSNDNTSDCPVIDGPNRYCHAWNSDQGGGKTDIINVCYCVNGNFCCDQNAEVAGGESAVSYYKDVGCNCDG